MSALHQVFVEVSVVLGSVTLPIHQLLRMGHGAVIELGITEDQEVAILVNEQPIAMGKVIVTGSAIAIEVTNLVQKPEVTRERTKPHSENAHETLAA